MSYKVQSAQSRRVDKSAEVQSAQSRHVDKSADRDGDIVNVSVKIIN